MKISKKVWKKYFQEIVDGDKNFDLRLADFKCKKGDILILKEWDEDTNAYTGRAIEKKVTYVLKTKNIPFFTKEDIERYGFQVIALK